MERPRLSWTLTAVTIPSGYHQRMSDWICSEARSAHSSCGAKAKASRVHHHEDKERNRRQEPEEQRRERKIPFPQAHLQTSPAPGLCPLYFFPWSRAQTEPPPPTIAQRRPFSQAGGSFFALLQRSFPLFHRVLDSIRPSEAALCNRGRRVAVGSVPNLSCCQYYTDRPAKGVQREKPESSGRVFRGAA